jgi:hypothetical protein
MLPPDLKPSRFARALADYGLVNCAANDTTLWIGLDGRKVHGNAWPIDSHPAARRRVVFLEAPVQAELVAAFVASPEAMIVDDLFIGTSQDYPSRRAGDAFPGYDMAAAVAALRGAHLPALKHLTLGDMEDKSGGFRLFGTVGDVTHVFAAAPRLEYLGLYGNFALSGPVHHGTLDTLDTVFDNFGVTGDPITQATLDQLLSSSLPSLRRLLLDMDEGGGEADMSIPDAFFTPGRFPSLRRVEIDRLTPAADARLNRFKQDRGLS